MRRFLRFLFNRVRFRLPDVESVAELGHEGWRLRNVRAGITSHKSYWGEELMVRWPYLSDRAKDLDRNYVRDIYAAIDLASDEVSLAD